MRPLFSVEMKPDAVETYRRHTPDAEHFCGDVREANFSRFHGAVQLVFGGPPCQPFSTGGLRKGAADARDMIPAFLDVLQTVKPQAFLIENVPGLAVASRRDYLNSALSSLEMLGFHVVWSVLNAADYGVPQSRKRLFIVGLRDHPFWFPRPTHGPEAGRDHVPASSVLSVDEPLGETPDCPVRYARYPDLRPSPYHGHVYNGGGRPINLRRPAPTVLASAGGYKTHWVDTLDIAPKYHAHLMAGGKPWEGTVPGARRLSVEESALLQTFPTSLEFAGRRSAQYAQVGDAVPPLLAEHLGRSLVTQLSNGVPSVDTHYPPEARLALGWGA